MPRSKRAGEQRARPLDDSANSVDGSPSFPPIDITVRIWLDTELVEVFSPMGNRWTAAALALAVEDFEDLAEAAMESPDDKETVDGDTDQDDEG